MECWECWSSIRRDVRWPSIGAVTAVVWASPDSVRRLEQPRNTTEGRALGPIVVRESTPPLPATKPTQVSSPHRYGPVEENDIENGAL
jgi:hypothetical protein